MDLNVLGCPPLDHFRSVTKATLGAVIDHFEAVAAITAEGSTGMANSSQSLRAQQDEAYQRSLRADAEKEKNRKKEEQAAKEKERMEMEAKENLERRKHERELLLEHLVGSLPDEPSSGIKLVVVLPDGSKIQRSFTAETMLPKLYDWVFTHLGKDVEIQRDAFILRTMLPPQSFPENKDTLLESGISAPMKLVVELL